MALITFKAALIKHASGSDIPLYTTWAGDELQSWSEEPLDHAGNQPDRSQDTVVTPPALLQPARKESLLHHRATQAVNHHLLSNENKLWVLILYT